MTANHKPPASRPHDSAVVELLKADPDFANEYLAAALEEADQPGGQAALLAALRHVAEAQGMARELIAARARMGLTRAHGIQRIGTTQSAIARLESGKRPPSLRAVVRLEHA